MTLDGDTTSYAFQDELNEIQIAAHRNDMTVVCSQGMYSCNNSLIFYLSPIKSTSIWYIYLSYNEYSINLLCLDGADTHIIVLKRRISTATDVPYIHNHYRSM